MATLGPAWVPAKGFTLGGGVVTPDLTGDGIADALVSVTQVALDPDGYAHSETDLVAGPFDRDLVLPDEAAASFPDASTAPVFQDATGDGRADVFVSTTSGLYLVPGPVAGRVDIVGAASWGSEEGLAQAWPIEFDGDGILDLQRAILDERGVTIGMDVVAGPASNWETGAPILSVTDSSCVLDNNPVIAAAMTDTQGDVDADGARDFVYAGRVGCLNTPISATLRGVYDLAGWMKGVTIPQQVDDQDGDGLADVIALGKLVKGPVTFVEYGLDGTELLALKHAPLPCDLDGDGVRDWWAEAYEAVGGTVARYATATGGPNGGVFTGAEREVFAVDYTGTNFPLQAVGSVDGRCVFIVGSKARLTPFSL